MSDVCIWGVCGDGNVGKAVSRIHKNGTTTVLRTSFSLSVLD